MCGRYVSPDETAIEREFNLVRSEWQFSPSCNAAPTPNVPVLPSCNVYTPGTNGFQEF